MHFILLLRRGVNMFLENKQKKEILIKAIFVVSLTFREWL